MEEKEDGKAGVVVEAEADAGNGAAEEEFVVTPAVLDDVIEQFRLRYGQVVSRGMALAWMERAAGRKISVRDPVPGEAEMKYIGSVEPRLPNCVRYECTLCHGPSWCHVPPPAGATVICNECAPPSIVFPRFPTVPPWWVV